MGVGRGSDVDRGSQRRGPDLIEPSEWAFQDECPRGPGLNGVCLHRSRGLAIAHRLEDSETYTGEKSRHRGNQAKIEQLVLLWWLGIFGGRVCVTEM